MTETEQLSNPERYKILIQIKKSRKKRRKTKYLNSDYDFIEEIFPDVQTAEQVLQRVSRFSTNEARPRIIIKYLAPVH